MKGIIIVTFVFAVYVMFVSLFYFSQDLTHNAIGQKNFYPLPAKSRPVTKQSRIFWEESTLKHIPATHQIFVENAISSNFIKSKSSDQTNDDKVSEEDRLKAALEKATERVKSIEIK